ncbi:MAG: histidine kinase [Bacteroidetes bacterium RBG_13_43_22]|nr:MAG: histidine kinase [Bacteroidetes bacterium RBG_13_43_22]
MRRIKFLKDNERFDFLDKFSTYKLLAVSLVSAVFFIYPNITIFMMEREYLGESKHTVHLLYFIFRYLYFSAFIYLLLRYNILKLKTNSVTRRWGRSFIITFFAYLIYVLFSVTLSPKHEWLSSIMLFQFLIMFIYCTLFGHVIYLYSEKRQREQEIEQLKLENLQSRYDALSNQINPHFFFNSLNGLTSVIRKKNEENALEYVNKLSDVFRYILQSDKKGLVTLGEELEFVKSFLYMMEIRFANKLVFNINVKDEMRDLKLPVLSLLPLIENVVVHNTIDSEHHMEVNICLNPQGELSVSNPVFPKLSPPDSNGTGLKNLENRFLLLMNRQIRILNDGNRFTVYLPLKKEKDENTDS